MQFPAVNWHEGLFLHPHHFQAWDRHWTERVSTGEQWQAPHGYGLLDIAINRDALASGFLQVDSLRCRTPGGSLIDWTNGAKVERRDLRPALESSPSNSDRRSKSNPGESPIPQECRYVDIFVGVPRLKLGHSNVDPQGHANGSRFRAQWLDLPDELDAACVKPVELRELNARILLSHEDLAGFDVLRIARVRRNEEDGVQVRIDGNYIPPLMECAASRLLQTEILSSLCDLLQQYCEQYSKQVIDSGGAFHASTPIDAQRMMVLQVVYPAVSVLRMLAQSSGVHPFTLYLELTRLAGSIDLLHPQRKMYHTAAYDHENLGEIFFALKRRILTGVEGLLKAPYRQGAFFGYENGMRLQIERSFFTATKRWFLGVHRGQTSVDTIHQWMTQGKLDWKMGSETQVEKLFTMRAPGVEVKRCNLLPATLPKSEDWIYYEIQGTELEAWKDVVATRSLAIRICDASIVDPSQLPGSRVLRLSHGHQVAELQFALFGVD